MTKTILAIKNIIFAILVPGTVAVYVPYFIFRSSDALQWPGISLLSISGMIIGGIGIALLLHCIITFAVQGKGTPAPIDPPKSLVIYGAYRYTRNPMYLSVLIILLSWAIVFKSIPVFIYAGIVFVCFHFFVQLFEEPSLRKKFGKPYQDYYNSIPRWGISLRPFAISNNPIQLND
jgi:protein-S-isoprenylcysteine O-methyltransferase Ste14